MNFRQQKQYDECVSILAHSRYQLVDNYIDCKTNMKINCDNGHCFNKTSVQIKKGIMCPICKEPKSRKKKSPVVSHGEGLCSQVLTELGLNYQSQFRILTLPRRKFDFFFVHKTNLDQRNVLLEFDGQQHFKYTKKFHKSNSHFLRRQGIDRLKTRKAMEEGYYIIRIDYSQQKYLREHIICALQQNKQIYLSDLQKYQYLFPFPT